MVAKPKNFQLRSRGTVCASLDQRCCVANRYTGQSTIGQHPVVVLSSPDESGLVMVASMSHRHPGNPPQRPTSMYNLPTQIHPVEGEGTINIGWPNQIHFSKLKQTQTSAPATMSASDLEALMKDIGKSTH